MLNESHLLKTTTSHYYNSQGESDDIGTGLSLATEKPFFFNHHDIFVIFLV